MRVPTYDTPTQLPGVGSTQAFTAPQMSDAPGRQLQQSGAALAESGKALSAIALDIQKDINEAEASKADNALAENFDRVLRAPGADGQIGGFLTLKGEDAVKSWGAVEAALKKLAEDGSSGLTNDTQRAMYQRTAQARLRTALGQGISHASEQTVVFRVGQATVRAGRAAAELTHYAGQDAASRQQFELNLQLGLREIATVASATGKGDPEQLKAVQDEWRATAYAGVLNTLYAQKRGADAKAFWDARSADLPDGEAKAKITNEVAVRSAAFAASDAVDAVWTQFGPKGLNGTVNSSAMDAALREQFKGDPDGLKAARAELTVREGDFKTDRNDRAATLQGQLLDDYLTGKIGSLAALKARPEFAALNGTGEQGKLLRYVEDYAHARATRNREDMERKGYMDFLVASDPATLSGMTRQQVLVEAKMLGPSLGTQLVNRFDALQKPGAMAQVKIDDDDFKTAVTDIMGVNPYERNLTDGTKADLGRLRSNLEQALSGEGRSWSREQRAAYVRSEVANTVMLNGGTFGRDKTKPVAALTAADIDKVVVPRADRETLVAAMQKAYRNAQTPAERALYAPTERNIRTQYLMHKSRTGRYLLNGN